MLENCWILKNIQFLKQWYLGRNGCYTVHSYLMIHGMDFLHCCSLCLLLFVVLVPPSHFLVQLDQEAHGFHSQSTKRKWDYWLPICTLELDLETLAFQFLEEKIWKKIFFREGNRPGHQNWGRDTQPYISLTNDRSNGFNPSSSNHFFLKIRI